MKTHVMTETTMHSQSEQQPAPADSRHENLSALIDGELSDAMARIAITQLGHNPADRARLGEYLAIGDAMRGLDARHDGFSARVMAALENQPVLLAPVPKKRESRPTLWLAAATAAAITWVVWQSNPRDDLAVPLASVQQTAPQFDEASPYLAAHQDFAQAVISTQEMRFTKASLEIRP
jgi:sigma-E factor negative regulatory protein RseA